MGEQKQKHQERSIAEEVTDEMSELGTWCSNFTLLLYFFYFH